MSYSSVAVVVLVKDLFPIQVVSFRLVVKGHELIKQLFQASDFLGTISDV